ncbi:phytanoyl-coa dioxygenase [Plakobranchus ocellatus]|uniref:Phytanoyl-coa dioxygenase n=1 Tax=Plakobranchus ocellatus TaxID=259542 RepID=A0AAV3XZ40_9GAST|nr:phytanoyl-coa dioxygenase [Plakobranchus ocellatus]
MKDEKTGGKFVWHQDYGYWYNFACLFPDMLTVFIAIDPCDKNNGCLQVLRGSHRAGRIDHGVTGAQVGADLTRVAELEARLEKIHVELQPGDALFFHCNLLHTSSANESENRRWALLTAYNCSHNSPYAKTVYGPYRLLSQLPNDAVTELGVNKQLAGKDIVVREQDGSLKSYFS